MSTTTDESASAKQDAILKPVFIPASVVIIAVIAIVIAFRKQAEDLTEQINTAITDGVGWWYVIVVNIFLGFALYFAFSKIGRIKLGRDDEEPEFGLASWFMMLFSAGMGIGLVFFGVAEPLGNFVAPPEAFGAEPGSTQAAQDSVGLMMLQWGLHPWAIYAMVGLGLAYMTFRRGRPLAVRWLLEPLLGRKRVEGWMGHVIDTVAIVGTLFGVATSFGFGVTQIVGGLESLGWASSSNWLFIGIITVVTLIAIFSVVSGVHKGLKWLSNINMTIAAGLAVLVFIIGPTILLLKAIPENAGDYLSLLPQNMFQVGAWTSDGWEAALAIAYWGWWTSWAPFVGMFLARISRGRTVREFIVGVLFAPTAASLVWFTIFGSSAIKVESDNRGTLTSGQDNDVVNSNTALFDFFGAIAGPGLTTFLSVVAICVVVFFFVTSSDSGSLVIDMLASGGSTETPVVTRVYWALLEGVAAAVLLVVGGSAALTALQTLSISTAAPFSVIMLLGCFAMLRAFQHDVARLPNYMVVLPVSDEGPKPVAPRHPLRGARGVSTTLIGLPPTRPSEEPADPDGEIVSFRHVNPDDMAPHPETGEPQLVTADDPLAGEVFDTPEFQASQEYVRQGGQPVPVGGADGAPAERDGSP